MARWGFMLVVALVVAHEAAAARVMPAGDSGLTDQKNFLTFGGVGGYSGIGSSGIPFGGVGAGVGSTGGLGGSNGFSGAGGIIGTGPNGGLTGVYGTVPGGIGTIGGVGGGAGNLPSP